MYMGKSLLIFSDHIFKVAAWWPYKFFRFPDSVGSRVSAATSEVCFGISVSNIMRMSFVAVGRSLTIVSYGAFKMTAL